MSTARGAKLKAQYNRVRTSTALRANDMWTNTIGVEANPQSGSNAAIEAAIYAPTHGGGGNRAQRREMAQQLIQATGYQPSVTDYQGLLTLAKEQGSLGVGTRGACKLCGGMGHTTKQCTNFLTGHNAVAGVDVVAGGAAGAGASRGLLPDPEALDFSDLDSSSSSGSDSDSGSSGSDSEGGRARAAGSKRESKKRKRSSSSKGKDKAKDKDRKDHKHKKRRSSASKKHKKSSKEHKSSKKRRREGNGGDSPGTAATPSFMTQSVKKQPRSPRDQKASPKRARVGCSEPDDADDTSSNEPEAQGMPGALLLQDELTRPGADGAVSQGGTGAQDGTVFSPVFHLHRPSSGNSGPAGLGPAQAARPGELNGGHHASLGVVAQPGGGHPTHAAVPGNAWAQAPVLPNSATSEQQHLLLQAALQHLQHHHATVVLPANHSKSSDTASDEAVHDPSHPLPQQQQQAPAIGTDVAAAAADEEIEYMDFDPLLFIKMLPPLHDVVPPGRVPLLPRLAHGSKRKTLVLDLDETLVHSCLEPQAVADFKFAVHFNGQSHTIAVRQRPHLREFMDRVSQLFEVVVFTASQRVYADRLLNIIDPSRRWVAHRIFRESCVVVDGNYLKDLSALGRDLATTLIVDNSPQAFGFQVDNGIPIESWYDDPADDELRKLLPFLEAVAAADDVRPAIRERYRLRDLINGVVAC